MEPNNDQVASKLQGKENLTKIWKLLYISETPTS